MSAQEVFVPAIAQTAGVVWSSTHALSTGYAIAFAWSVQPPAVAAASIAHTVLELPVDARVERALFDITSDAAANARLSSIATVSPTTSPDEDFTLAASVDFGSLVTVGGLRLTSERVVLTVDVETVYRWTGTGWQRLSDSRTFPDTSTQRLLALSSGPGTAQDLVDHLVDHVGAVLPVVPTGLELLVEGRSVWFERQGASALPAGVEPVAAPTSSASAYTVDRTDAVREALARAVAAAAPGTTMVTIPVALRATTPGQLSLTPRVTALRVHDVLFVPDGPSRSLELLEEGLVSVDVTPPQAQTVHEVALRLRARVGPSRVTPAVGPDLTDKARLVLGGGRTVLLGLPRSLLAHFATLDGVRLRLQVPPGADGSPGSGGQITGRLLATAGPDRPGAPVPGGELAALTVSVADPAWYTLVFAKAVPVPAPPPPAPGEDDGVGAWLELQTAYGEIECLLTASPSTDPTTPGAPLRRRLAGGGTVPLTPVADVGQMLAAVRLAGAPDRDTPLPAVSLLVPGSGTTLGTTPTTDGVDVSLTLLNPVSATTPVTLQLVCAAPGSFTLEDVHVTYLPTGGTP